jgi:hypothetical protein
VAELLEQRVVPASQSTVKAAGLGRVADVRSALEWLPGKGYVQINDGPRRSKLHISVCPYDATD